jgi:NhaP-type Na+/H+ and K+/H+ antiporter
MEASHHLILLGSALVLLSIFAGVFSARFGAPLLLVFLGCLIEPIVSATQAHRIGGH